MRPEIGPASRPQQHSPESPVPVQTQIPDCTWPAIPNDPGAQALALQYQLERSEWLPADEIRLAQFRQLHNVLCDVYRNVDYWRSPLRSVDFEPGVTINAEQFQSLPILGRTEVQNL